MTITNTSTIAFNGTSNSLILGEFFCLFCLWAPQETDQQAGTFANTDLLKCQVTAFGSLFYYDGSINFYPADVCIRISADWGRGGDYSQLKRTRADIKYIKRCYGCVYAAHPRSTYLGTKHVGWMCRAPMRPCWSLILDYVFFDADQSWSEQIQNKAGARCWGM